LSGSTDTMPIAHSPSPALGSLLERNDSRLEPLFRATSDAEAERAIAEVITRHAIPLARRIVHGHVQSHASFEGVDVDDLVSLVSMRLLLKLRATRDSVEHAVQSIEKYVSRLTYNAIHDHYRRRFPERTRLKNRLRYLLTHDRELALWSTADGTMTCGDARWSGRAAQSMPPVVDVRAEDDASATLRAVFRQVDHPVEVDALVDLMSRVWNVEEHSTETLDVEIATPQPRIDVQIEERQMLGRLWNEIRELRPLQKKALLLNLRDADTSHVLTLFVGTGTATFDELAAQLELSTDQLSAIWNELPLEDQRIAAMLGLTRQQVINLRHAARHRLGRRLSR